MQHGNMNVKFLMDVYFLVKVHQTEIVFVSEDKLLRSDTIKYSDTTRTVMGRRDIVPNFNQISKSGKLLFHLRCWSRKIQETAMSSPATFFLQVGKYGTPTRCNNNSFIDLQDQLNMFRASFCPSSGAQDW
jgi:hypothetical protein